MRELVEWGSFYVIVGAAAGALIGLQFVVLTLIAERPSLRSAEGAAAFSTPTVVHFAVALLLSALLSAPWRALAVPAAAWGLIGVWGLGYSLVVARRMRRQQAYRPVLTDWVFNLFLPAGAYALLLLSALFAELPRAALFGAAAGTLLLLFVGIYNSWDVISYHVLVSRPATESDPRKAADESPQDDGSTREHSATESRGASTSPKRSRKPIAAAELRALTARSGRQPIGAARLVRKMRDADRY